MVSPPPPPDAQPGGAHYAVCPSTILGTSDPRREDHWQRIGDTAADTLLAAKQAAEDLALEHGGQWSTYGIGDTGTWMLVCHFPADAVKLPPPPPSPRTKR